MCRPGKRSWSPPDPQLSRPLPDCRVKKSDRIVAPAAPRIHPSAGVAINLSRAPDAELGSPDLPEAATRGFSYPRRPRMTGRAIAGKRVWSAGGGRKSRDSGRIENYRQKDRREVRRLARDNIDSRQTAEDAYAAAQQGSIVPRSRAHPRKFAIYRNEAWRLNSSILGSNSPAAYSQAHQLARLAGLHAPTWARSNIPSLYPW